MDAEGEQVTVRSDSRDHEAQRWLGRQVVGPVEALAGEVEGFVDGIELGQVVEVGFGDLEATGRPDHLSRPPPLGHHPAAEHGVPLLDGRQRVDQPFPVERTGQDRRGSQIVRSAFGGQLLEEPHPLL